MTLLMMTYVWFIIQNQNLIIQVAADLEVC